VSVLPLISDELPKVNPSELKEALKSSFNLENLKKDSIRQAFDREVENAQEERACQNQDRRSMLEINLGVVVKLQKLLAHQKKEQRESDENYKRDDSRFSNDLKSKVKALKSEGKVLDITTMTEKGTGSKKIVYRESNNRRRLSNDKTDRFYYVVYNPSKQVSCDGVRNFLTSYGGFEESQIQNTVDAIKSGGKVNFSKGKSPTRSPLLSPRSKKKSSKNTSTDVDDIFAMGE